MEAELHRFAAVGIEVVFDASIGMIRDITVTAGGRRIEPFAKAPWRDLPLDDPRFPDGMAPHLARLSGDFFCAPFSTDDIEGGHGHGRTANSRWRFVGERRSGSALLVRFELEATIAGMSVSKSLLLIDGHPFLYQQHVLSGADVAIPVSHHAMIDASGGLDLATSRKAFAETPPTPLEPDPSLGRSLLTYPARTADPAAFPMADGSTASLLEFPIGERHTDFVMLVDEDRAPRTLGWSIAHRRWHGDSVILAKPADVLPATMLWYSDRGRDYAPWLGEHADVLGIEDGCSYSLHGWSASIAANPLSNAGIPTAIRVGVERPSVISYAMGAVPGKAVRAGGDFRSGVAGGAADGTIPFDAELITSGRPFEELLRSRAG
jgi:hypothetical protein